MQWSLLERLAPFDSLMESLAPQVSHSLAAKVEECTAGWTNQLNKHAIQIVSTQENVNHAYQPMRSFLMC